MTTARTIALFLKFRPQFMVAFALFVVLVATSSGYGWHGDELYFVVAGQHPAWAYPDQPLFTPLLVGALNAISGGSLVIVRLASALAGAATAILAGEMAGQLGGTARARLIASLTWAVGGVSLVTGHFIDTTTFDILATAGACSCLILAVTRNSGRWIVTAGAVVGAGLLNKMLIGFVIALVIALMLAIGPRRIFFTRYAAIAAGLAVLGAAPYLIWQALHGWPQVALAAGISQGGAEGGRVGVIPFQILLVSPFLAAVWIAGIVRLFRNRSARPHRAFAIAYLVMVVALIVVSGKAYYAAGLLPVLVASGGISVDLWLARSFRDAKLAVVSCALVFAFVINAVLGLPIIPPGQLTRTGVEAINPDAGEQVGWEPFISAVAKGYASIPRAARATAVIFTKNYTEAGAVDKFGGPLGLPQAYSGHNGFAQWGPPPAQSGPVELIGFDLGDPTSAKFVHCRVVTHVKNGYNLNNEEQGDLIQVCSKPAEPWSRLWPSLIHYG
jgi:hypothetical protein